MLQTRLSGSFLGDESSSSRKRSRRDRDGDDDAERDVNQRVKWKCQLQVSSTKYSWPKKVHTDNFVQLAEAMKRKFYSQHRVRTSTQDRTLDSMFPLASQNTVVSPSNVATADSPNTPSNALTRGVMESECLLTSVKDLRKKVQKRKHRRELLLPTPLGH
jgi:hypothetical protein